ncbi:MAG: guanylate kinase [Gammaproteobacteria bacterium]|nr:guanylate kinase [Gammaproteobacteria bacterium]
MNKKGCLIVIAAPSGGGKTTLVNALLKAMPDIKLSISHTTRPIRPGEQDGINYYFVSDQDFKKLLDERVFLEYAKVYDYFYGTSKVWVEAELNKGSNIILELDWQGARQIKAMFEHEAKFIYLLPPSLKALQERLRRRAQDHPEVIEHRLAQAKEDISHYDEFDYLVVNENLEQAVNDLVAIITSIRLDIKQQKNNLKSLLRQLLDNY